LPLILAHEFCSAKKLFIDHKVRTYAKAPEIGR
jgi:hypothetical protein